MLLKLLPFAVTIGILSGGVAGASEPGSMHRSAPPSQFALTGVPVPATDPRCAIVPGAAPEPAHHDAGAAGTDARSTSTHLDHPPTGPAPPARAAEHPHPAASSAAEHGEVHGAGACHPTPEQQAAADSLVASVREVLNRRFDLPEKAILAGYERGANESPKNVHYISPAEQRSPAVLDPNRPEGVMYDEWRRVIGAVFIMPRIEDNGPQVAGCLTTWHRHSRGSEVSTEALHVWIVDRPGGPFSH